MRVFLQQLKWQFLILQRNQLITICILVTLMYAGIFFGIKHLGNTDKVLTLLIYNDPAVIGVIFLGLSIIMDKNQRVLDAIFVTPVNLHVFLITRIMALSIIGWACGLGMGLSALGFTFNVLHFSFGVLGTSSLFCIIGLFVVSYSSEFLLFMIKSIPLLLIMSLPLLNYFHVTDIRVFYFLPVQGCLNLIINSYEGKAVYSELIYGYLSSAIWISLLYVIAFRIFKSKMAIK